ncbi:hypothetical protein BO70DRAFT_358399 [Aspergillus heteromorphus CBS 117.55]|uniref:Inheritance of peroxisomes protein 1 n=1 Tax=Aspergillus heteromorphus CBS 117.55 TaxID=1448321 RepID=A0A317WWZ7_9EURO|nr:uncharacterized protein BO70DRAFT_358399 [Aspergillus heteromorphus CBS 117.55]PWY90936.1 hypothetical protein BO70DRAFT_358399 [Aspergillus heteromorphus CBS 117.55]
MSNLSDAPPQTLSIRRSATLPSKLNPRTRRQSESFRPSENDLFYHPAAKVVHFSPRALAPIPSSTAPSDFDYPVDTVETLPWRSPTERTVAFAPLRLESIQGLTVFLKCGNVVHAILKNSQCWCVDGESTFVLRIRPLTYYRIELPNDSDDNKGLVAEIKDVLPRVLRYEVTPCPFKRGFTVEIPEEAKAPRRKRAWRPKGRRESAPINSGYVQGLLSKEFARDSGDDTDGNATDDSGFTRGSNSTALETIPDEDPEPQTESAEETEPMQAAEPAQAEAAPASEPAQTADPAQTEPVRSFDPSPPSEPQPSAPVDLPRRSVQETEQSFQTLLARFEDSSEQVDPDMSFSSSVESFHSLSALPELDACSEPTTESTDNFQNENSDSPSSEDQSGETGRSRLSVYVDCWDNLSPSQNAEDFSEEPKPTQNTVSDIPRPVNRHSMADSNPNLSSMSVEFRRRSRASREREVSPMPPASTLALTRPPKHDAASLIHKTCALVLVPPIQLLVVLIHIAARIVIGPALNSAMGELNRKIEYEIASTRETVDDFDLPLPDCSRSSSEDAGRKDFAGLRRSA